MHVYLYKTLPLKEGKYCLKIAIRNVHLFWYNYIFLGSSLMQFVILINIHCRWVVLFGPPTFTCHWQNRFSFLSYHALISLSRVLQSGSLRWSSNYILYTYFEEHPHNLEYFSRWEGKTFTNAGYAWQHCAYHFDYISCAVKLKEK